MLQRILRKPWKTILMQDWESSGRLSAKLRKLSIRSTRTFLSKSKALFWVLRLTHYMRKILRVLRPSFKNKTTWLTKSTKTSSKCYLQSSEQTSRLMISSLSLRNLVISLAKPLLSQTSCLNLWWVFFYLISASISTTTSSKTQLLYRNYWRK